MFLCKLIGEEQRNLFVLRNKHHNFRIKHKNKNNGMVDE